MMMAMIRATYYITRDTVIQFYFIVYAHNASFILEFYSQLRVWAIACMAGTSPLRDVGKA